MGKTSRWFRRLLGCNKKENTSSVSDSQPPLPSSEKKKKKKWGFVRSFKDKESSAVIPPQVKNNNDQRKSSYRERSSPSPSPLSSQAASSYLDGVGDPNKHAIAVAAATAAVAEAAVAAADAAVAVVKLTSSSRRCTTAYVSSSSSGLRREDWASLKIQSAFRGYLARRALQALKGLVKLQALVRGHLVRKKTSDTLRCMQSLVRVQVRARAGRSVSESRHPKHKHSSSHQSGPATPEKYERSIRSNSTRHDRPSNLKRNCSYSNNRNIVDPDRMQVGWNWLDQWMDESSWDHCKETLMKSSLQDNEKSDKILEIDPGKSHFNSKLKNAFSSAKHTSDRYSHSFTTLDSPSKDSTTAQRSASSTSSGEVQSMNRRKLPQEVEDAVFCTADNGPQLYSASSRPGSARIGPFTPAKSECSQSFISGYSDHPNYMSNTESSKAKVRSQSAPKQRLQFQKSSSMKRYSIHGFGGSQVKYS